LSKASQFDKADDKGCDEDFISTSFSAGGDKKKSCAAVEEAIVLAL
jgi:hypothetical protein